MPVNKVRWQQVGHVTEPGRYMFRFGWVTIAADDLAIWSRFPEASFTLVQIPAPPLTPEPDEPTVENDEFHLGAFDLHVIPESRSIGIQPTSELPAAEIPAQAQSSV